MREAGFCEKTVKSGGIRGFFLVKKYEAYVLS